MSLRLHLKDPMFTTAGLCGTLVWSEAYTLTEEAWDAISPMLKGKRCKRCVKLRRKALASLDLEK